MFGRVSDSTRVASVIKAHDPASAPARRPRPLPAAHAVRIEAAREHEPRGQDIQRRLLLRPGAAPSRPPLRTNLADTVASPRYMNAWSAASRSCAGATTPTSTRPRFSKSRASTKAVAQKSWKKKFYLVNMKLSRAGMVNIRAPGWYRFCHSFYQTLDLLCTAIGYRSNAAVTLRFSMA